MDKEILLLLLDKEFFTQNKGRVVRELFVEELRPVYDTIVKAYDKYEKLSLQDVWLLHMAANPTITAAKKKEYTELFKSLAATPPIDKAVGKDLLASAWQNYYFANIAEYAQRILEGRDPEGNKTNIYNVLDKLKSNTVVSNDNKRVTCNIEELLKSTIASYKWMFNLPELHKNVGPVGGGMFMILLARTDCGKTACWVSMACSPGGFLDQGAKVLVIGNEEDQKRTMLRCISSYTGMTYDQLVNIDSSGNITGLNTQNIKAATEIFKRVRDRLEIIDDGSITIGQLESIVAEKKPDILIIDQLDKIHTTGRADRRDLELGALYQQTREIGKKHMPGGLVIGITQASADAHDKLHYGFEAMADSKTGKPAEADIIMTIGMRGIAATGGQDDGFRTMNIPKLKTFNGRKDAVNFKLDTKLSRMLP